ncbi:MAG TPA: nucleotidyltransferase family protein [Gemmatimonadales bacterium]|nr:nucleotidyltransferase family protein [Gemmatimonadales bacterium]
MRQVVDALRLRTWAIQVLSTGWTPPPDVDSKAWKLFLRAERCAVALSTRTEGHAPPLLHAAATIELQRVLSARGQIEQLGRSVSEIGERVVVLKGGVMAMGATVALDLVDVDVLAQPDAAPKIAGVLDSHGYVSQGGGASAHLSQRRQPYAVHIEVHHSLSELPAKDVWARAEPVAGRPGLWRPAPEDQLWHALLHSTYSHPFRRGALRDLLLIGWADASCGEDERAEIEKRLRSDPDREALLREVLRMAREVRDDRAPIDPFRQEAAAHYLLSRRPALFGESGLRPHIVRSAYAMIDGEKAREGYWKSVVKGWSETSPWGWLASLERAWPFAGRMLRRVLRVVRLPVVEAMAYWVLVRARSFAGAQEGYRMAAKTLDMRSGDP